MTGNPVNMAARAAARRLAPTHGTALETQVEAALYARGADQRPDQYADLTTLGSLIVSVATLAWTIYRDQRNLPPRPTRETLAKQVQDDLRPGDATPPTKQHDDVVETGDVVEVIEIVVDEILKNTED